MGLLLSWVSGHLPGLGWDSSALLHDFVILPLRRVSWVRLVVMFCFHGSGRGFESQDQRVRGIERIGAGRAFSDNKINKLTSGVQLLWRQGAHLTQHWVPALASPSRGRCSVNSCWPMNVNYIGSSRTQVTLILKARWNNTLGPSVQVRIEAQAWLASSFDLKGPCDSCDIFWRKKKT